jgi:hypothetical protein
VTLPTVRAGPGCGKTNSRSPRWDPSAITGVSSRPPHDVATPRYAPPRATSPRCARCSEVSLSDPGIRPRYACSAGRPAPHCCKAPRPHRHPRPCVLRGQCHGNREDHRRSAHDRRSAGGANGAQVELAEGYAPRSQTAEPCRTGPWLPGTPSTASRPKSATAIRAAHPLPARDEAARNEDHKHLARKLRLAAGDLRAARQSGRRRLASRSPAGR